MCLQRIIRLLKKQHEKGLHVQVFFLALEAGLCYNVKV